MIFSENRFPLRIKSGAGFYGIMLSSGERRPIDHGISAQIAPFTGTNIVNVSLRYMSTTSWYHLGELFA